MPSFSVDVLANISRHIDCLDHGFVTLLDCLPRMTSDDRGTLDEFFVYYARCLSPQDGILNRRDSELDYKTLKYMITHGHTSPFEQVQFQFLIQLPIFVERQWVRHRTARMNEVSGRYSTLSSDFHYPEFWRRQDDKKKQQSFDDQELDAHVKKHYLPDIKAFQEKLYDIYLRMLDDGVAREQAREFLGLNIYTKKIWQLDAHNLINNFLKKRLPGRGAQPEIAVYASAILEIIRPLIPKTLEYHAL